MTLEQTAPVQTRSKMLQTSTAISYPAISQQWQSAAENAKRIVQTLPISAQGDGGKVANIWTPDTRAECRLRPANAHAMCEPPRKDCMMSDRVPVTTVDELMALDLGEIIEGYRDGCSGDPEPGDNRSKAYWHGWRNGRVDGGHAKLDGAMTLLVQRIVRDQHTGVSTNRDGKQ